jgi:hypothetical protein
MLPGSDAFDSDAFDSDAFDSDELGPLYENFS